MDQLTLAYRPESFEDLVGQPHVTRVLTEAVAAFHRGEPIPQAYVLAGTRGTGKTTTARILASDLNGEPSDSALVEQDAASHNGVDDIRNLIQLAQYQTPGKARTIVLDEAHSLSKPAWNALLKSLEEPPPGTFWVLVTTEVTKIPEPVLSRCLVFTFQPITAGDIRDRLAQIAESEGVHAEPEALDLISERARGGLRDAVMMLDQIRMDGEVTVASYQRIFGTPHLAPAFLDACASADFDRALDVVDSYVQRVGEPSELIDESITELTARLRTERGNPRRLVEAIRALWSIRHELRGSHVGIRPALSVALAEVATALADIPEDAERVQRTTPATPDDITEILGG